MTDMIYITNMTVFSHRTTVTKVFLEIYNPKYAIMLCEKKLCNKLNVIDKNYETEMAYITNNHKHTIMTRLIHDCA